MTLPPGVSRVFIYRGRVVGVEYTPEATAALLAVQRSAVWTNHRSCYGSCCGQNKA